MSDEYKKLCIEDGMTSSNQKIKNLVTKYSWSPRIGASLYNVSNYRLCERLRKDGLDSYVDKNYREFAKERRGQIKKTGVMI
jgi:hypothetical protein